MSQKKWLKIQEVFENLDSKQCVVTIYENGLFSLYGEPLCPVNQNNKILCRIEGANKMIKDGQLVIPFCKI